MNNKLKTLLSVLALSFLCSTPWNDTTTVSNTSNTEISDTLTESESESIMLCSDIYPEDTDY